MGLRFESPYFAVKPPRPKQATPSRAKPKKALPKKRDEPRVKTEGKVLAGQKLVRIVTDPDYIKYLHTLPGTFTGVYGTESDPIVAMHIGNPGKNLKNDAEALPERQSLHALTHGDGITAVLDHLRDKPKLVIAILRAYARECHGAYETELSKQEQY